jgi:hypothetical protein
MGAKDLLKGQERLCIKAKGWRVLGEDGPYEVRELAAAYGHDFGPKNGSLRLENTYCWNFYPGILIT